MKICVASSRNIGEKCKEYALAQQERLGIEIVDDPRDCDVFISVLYDKILPSEFIRSKIKCFNFHPGLLPEYRGSGAYSWVIINEEKVTGVTLHEIDIGIDTGPIITTSVFTINLGDTAETLFERAEEVIYEMFVNWFYILATQPTQLRSTPQVRSEGTTYYRNDLEKAKDITRYKRAFTFKGKESCYYWEDGKKHYL